MNKRIRKKQLKKNAPYVSSSDTWSLDITIAKFVLPRLKMFRKVTDFYPDYDLNTFEEWCGVLDKMIAAFELIAGETLYEDQNEENNKVINEGLDLFRKYYFSLWW